MIMSFTVLKYFTSGKISFRRNASLWSRNFKLEKVIFFQNSELTVVAVYNDCFLSVSEVRNRMNS